MTTNDEHKTAKLLRETGKELFSALGHFLGVKMVDIYSQPGRLRYLYKTISTCTV